jgi:hypothetical protein
MRNVRHQFIKNFSLGVFAFFLTELPVFAFAECPSGYHSIKEYAKDEVGLKWGDEPSGTYSRCLGIQPGMYQCGNIRIGPVNLENTSLLPVKPSNPSISSILFEEDLSFTVWDGPKRQWCEREGAQVMCYEESISKKTFMPSSSNRGINKRIDYLLKQKYIAECAEVSF